MVKPMVPTVPTVILLGREAETATVGGVDDEQGRHNPCETLRKHEEHEENGAYAYRTFAEEQAHGAEQLVPVGKVVDVDIG